MGVFLLEVELNGHSILFEDIKRRDANQQNQCTIDCNGHEAIRLCAWCGSLHFFKEKGNGK